MIFLDHTIFLDLDGVLVNFVQGCIDHFNLSTTHNDIWHWDQIVEETGLTKEQFYAALDYDFWVNLELYDHASQLLSFLQPARFYILTSLGAGKPDWIKKHLPGCFWGERYMIGPAKHLAARPGRILIDDKEENVRRWIGFGGIGMLFPRPWNTLHYKADKPINSIILDWREVWEDMGLKQPHPQ